MGPFACRPVRVLPSLGGYAGGQAEFLRVPFADVGPHKVPAGLNDEQVLFLSDIFPTGYMAAEFCNIQARRHDRSLGMRAGRSICDPQRFSARGRTRHCHRYHPRTVANWRKSRGAEVVDFMRCGRLRKNPGVTHGRGADACIDAVGTEPDTTGSWDLVVDRVKVATYLGTDRPHVLRQAVHCCRNFGTVSIVGVYGGFLDKIPFGSAINRGLTFRMAQTPVQRYLPMLLKRIEERRNRPLVRDHPPSITAGRSRTLQDVPRQKRRVHQGCPQTLEKVSAMASQRP